MVKINPNSSIEIWGTKYINGERQRRPEDMNKVIIQIEPGTANCEYIVEVIDPEECEVE